MNKQGKRNGNQQKRTEKKKKRISTMILKLTLHVRSSLTNQSSGDASTRSNLVYYSYQIMYKGFLSYYLKQGAPS